MKKLKNLLAFALFIVFANNAIAQEKSEASNDQKIGRQKEMQAAKEKLAMTADQQIKFAAIYKKFGLQIKEIKNSEIDKSEKKQKLKALQTQKDEELKAILTETQFKTYLESKEELRKKFREKLKED